EDLHHGIADGHGMRNECRVVQQTYETLRDVGLAGTRGAIDEERLTGVECRSEAIEQLRIQDDVGKRLVHARAYHETIPHALRSHHFGIYVQRQRSRDHVAPTLEGSLPAGPPTLRERVAQAVIIRRAGAN